MVDNVKLPEWETVFFALLESAETHKVVEIDEHVSVRHEYWEGAYLWYDDDYNKKMFDLNLITILCCEDEEEYAGECASELLRKLEEWYGKQRKRPATIFDATCWEEAEPFLNEVEVGLEQSVYQNCVWGWEGMQYGLKTLLDNEWNYGLDVERTRELWQLAYWWVAEGCMVSEW